MLKLELPAINVLSKVDLLGDFEQLAFSIEAFTEAQVAGPTARAAPLAVPPLSQLNDDDYCRASLPSKTLWRWVLCQHQRCRVARLRPTALARSTQRVPAVYVYVDAAGTSNASQSTDASATGRSSGRLVRRTSTISAPRSTRRWAAAQADSGR